MVVWRHIPVFKSIQDEVCSRLLLSAVWCAITRWYLLSPNDFSYFNAWAEAVSSTLSTTHRSRKPKHQPQVQWQTRNEAAVFWNHHAKMKMLSNGQKSTSSLGLENPFKALKGLKQRFEFQLCLSLSMWVWTVYLISQVSFSLSKKQGQSEHLPIRIFLQIKWENARQVLNTVHSTLEALSKMFPATATSNSSSGSGGGFCCPVLNWICRRD